MFITKPYSDELLSSWFMRLSRINHTNISTLICHIFKDNPLSYHTVKFHIKDIDLYKLTTKQTNLLFENTGVKADNFQLFKYSGFLDEKVDRYNKKWITEPKATKHNTKHFYGTRYCPKCLKEKAYIKQLWRIMLYNVCIRHSCYLLVSCTKCNAKFMYIDNGYTRELYQCHNCSFDLRNADVQIAKEKDIKSQTKLFNILNSGYYKLNNRFYYSIGLFTLIKKLLHTVMHVNNIQLRYINQLQPIKLSRFISHILFLLDNFPRRLNNFYKKNCFTNIMNILGWAERDKQNFTLPSWYISGIEYKTIVKRGVKK